MVASADKDTEERSLKAYTRRPAVANHKPDLRSNPHPERPTTGACPRIGNLERGLQHLKQAGL